MKVLLASILAALLLSGCGGITDSVEPPLQEAAKVVAPEMEEPKETAAEMFARAKEYYDAGYEQSARKGAALNGT
ncbi:hypothetical protein N6H13_07520 [Paenibacillus sp. CC-CFT742]|nr:hypothetical protein [Paenibacillus sp. CC-CFT742]WJH30485.1 hypothetical protein N6H13_07520 [Paenibacillus sp. CC-CFT742]